MRFKLPFYAGLSLVSASSACSLLVTIPDSLTTPHDEAGAGGGTAEAGAPAGDGGASRSDGGPAFQCPPLGTALFCDDFDHGQPFATWDRVTAGTGFGAVVDTTIALSAPGALLAQIDETDTDGCVYARAEKTIAGSFSSARLAVALRVEGPESLTQETLAVISVDKDDNNLGCLTLVVVQWTGAAYELRLLEQTATPQTSIPTITHETPIRLTPQVWQRLDLEVDYVAKTLRLRDDVGAELWRDTLGLTCAASPGAAGANVGFHCSNKQSISRAMRADDVVFDAH